MRIVACQRPWVAMLIVAVSVFLSASTLPAAAKAGLSESACTQGDDIDARIRACTALLQNDARLSNFNKAKYLGYRAVAYIQKSDLKQALADLDVSIAVDGSQFGAWGTRAGVNKSLGNFDQALADIDQCIKLMPQFAPARSVRGDILRVKGDVDGALREYETALRMDPTDLGSYIGRAEVYRVAGRFKDAESELARALAIDNRIAEIYTTKGQIAEANQDIAGARDAYQRALAQPQSVRFGNKTGKPIIDATKTWGIARARLAVLDGVQPGAEAPSVTAEGQIAKPATRKLALVIGNGDYRIATRLPNPPRDARLLAQQLRDIGFETIEGIDLDREAMNSQLKSFLVKAPTSQIAMIFYAGHGLQIDGKNYLVPVDARIEGGKNAVRELIDLDFILAGLDDKLRANIIVLDACRDNPSRRRCAGGRSESFCNDSLGACAAVRPVHRRHARGRDAACFRDGARSGRARWRWPEQPVFLGPRAPHRDARPRVAADADPGSFGGGGRDQGTTGAMVKFGLAGEVYLTAK